MRKTTNEEKEEGLKIKVRGWSRERGRGAF